jgi:hypothetical protein
MTSTPEWPAGSVWVDWSGVTAVVVCDTCGQQFGVWFNWADAVTFARQHAELGHATIARARRPIEVKQPKPVRICITEGCGLKARSRGLCDSCYAKARYREARANVAPRPMGRPPKPKRECSIAGCDAPVKATGLCNAHYLAAQRADRAAA